MRVLVERNVDSGPVLDDGQIVGMLSTGDLVVEEARVHYPTIVNFLGVNVTLPFEHQKLDDSVAKALGRVGRRGHDGRAADHLRRRHGRGRGHPHARPRGLPPAGRRRRRRAGRHRRPGRHPAGHRRRYRRGRVGRPSCRCAPRGPRSTSMPSPTTCARCASWSRRPRCARSSRPTATGTAPSPSDRPRSRPAPTWLGVALVEEGAVLRRAGIDVPILLLSQPRPADVDPAVRLGLRLSAYTADGLDAIAAAARRHGVTAPDPPQGQHGHEPRGRGAGGDRGAGPVDRRSAGARARGAVDALRRGRRARQPLHRRAARPLRRGRGRPCAMAGIDAGDAPRGQHRRRARPPPQPLRPRARRHRHLRHRAEPGAGRTGRPASRRSSCGPRWPWSSGCRPASASPTA